jgi:hypothetical protein
MRDPPHGQAWVGTLNPNAAAAQPSSFTRGRSLTRLAALLLLIGCVREVRIPVRELVVPKCQVPNSFELCKQECLKEGMRPVQATEDETRYSCNCAPFDA